MPTATKFQSRLYPLVARVTRHGETRCFGKETLTQTWIAVLRKEGGGYEKFEQLTSFTRIALEFLLE